MNKRPLYVYVIATAIVWALLLGGVWFLATPRFHDILTVCGGFFIGMLAMYIAVHVYRWK
jgi:hypothetical protein